MAGVVDQDVDLAGLRDEPVDAGLVLQVCRNESGVAMRLW